MTEADDTPGGSEPDVAEAVRRLGHALARRHIDATLAGSLVPTLDALTAQVLAAPERDKQSQHARSTRYQAFVETGEAAPTPDGERIEFDQFSIVGGPGNPFGTGARHHREGDEAVTTVTFGPAYEGPPGRVHGGAVALVVDEATATVMPMLGRFAFTGAVSLRLKAPAPLGVEVQFRSRFVGEEGRKMFVRCVGSGPDGVFVEADATYIAVDPFVTMPWLGEARLAAIAEQQRTQAGEPG